MGPDTVCAVSVPQFDHDCDVCRFLGQYHEEGDKNYDLYICQTVHTCTVIARYGNDPPAYLSGLAAIGCNTPLQAAAWRAVDVGLLDPKKRTGNADEKTVGETLGMKHTMYKGDRVFDKEQLLFVVESILTGIVDVVGDHMPHNVNKINHNGHNSNCAKCNQTAMEHYLPLCDSRHQEALETGGMALAIFGAQLINDGIGAADALAMASNFHHRVRTWVFHGWEDWQNVQEGNTPGTKINQLYEFYPDCRHCAEAFVEEMFREYLDDHNQ